MSTEVLSHHIQKTLFKSLVEADSLRYSQLKPKGLEPNLFMYHLKELIKFGYVEKVSAGYSLTNKGKELATRFSVRETLIREMPSTITVVKLRAEDGQTLLYRRQRQPYIGALGFPSGKIHLGETLKVAAERELLEKCNYKAAEVKLKIRGEFSLVTTNGDFINNHVLGHVWEGQVGKNKKEFDNPAGQTFWADWQKQDYSKFISGFKEIVEACQNNDQQFVLDMHFGSPG